MTNQLFYRHRFRTDTAQKALIGFSVPKEKNAVPPAYSITCDRRRNGGTVVTPIPPLMALLIIHDFASWLTSYSPSFIESIFKA